MDEIERLDAQLSAYRSDSELSGINARAASEPVRVSVEMFSLMQTCARFREQTEGAFDITIGPLMRCWGFVGGSRKAPDSADLATVRGLVGMQRVVLNEENRTVSFDREGVRLDLGAIGKGYAVQKAARILKEAGVQSALIHGGTSSVYAIGTPPDAPTWKVAIRHPAKPDKILEVADLRDSSLSVSAAHGKSFTMHSVEYGHVIDPRTGAPSQNAILAAVIGPDATQGDALSTALLVLGKEWLPKLIEANRRMKGLVATYENGELTVISSP